MPKIQAVQCLLPWSESNWAFNSFQRSEIIPHPKSLSCTHSKLLLQALLPLYPRHSPNALTWRPQLDGTGRRGSIIYFHQHVVCVCVSVYHDIHQNTRVFPNSQAATKRLRWLWSRHRHVSISASYFQGAKVALANPPLAAFRGSNSTLSGSQGVTPVGLNLTSNLWEQFFDVFRNENTNKIVCNKAEHVTDSLQVCIFGGGLALKHHYNRCARTRFDMW